MNWESIAKVNSEIKTLKLKRNVKDKYGNWEEVETEYAEVKERVIAFRKVFPYGTIETEINFTDNYVLAKATVRDGTNLLATGNARELASKPFALENAETSAIGRALGYCGFGINGAIASAEDIENMDSPSGIFTNMPSEAQIEKFNKLSTQQRADILNLMHVKDVKLIKADMLEELIRNVK